VRSTASFDRLRSASRHRRKRLEVRKPGHTLGTTDLVHAGFLRLVDANVDWQDRTQFLAVAARVMRRILVDHARASHSARRGSGAPRVSLDKALAVAAESAQVLDLDGALTRLAALDARKSQTLEMLYFGGLTYTETAGALNISETTVLRDLKVAKAWMRHELRAAAFRAEGAAT
jgi:RNA polymerase sigma factor (TIGR02999 family)